MREKNQLLRLSLKFNAHEIDSIGFCMCTKEKGRLFIANSGRISINHFTVHFVWSRSSAGLSTSIQQMHTLRLARCTVNRASERIQRQCFKPYYVYSNLLSLRCVEPTKSSECALLAPLTRCSSSRQTKSQSSSMCCECVRV